MLLQGLQQNSGLAPRMHSIWQSN
ncbi:hypothetical protein THICB3360081 [Thiomonas sp. CB3]|nr:hypothetical protein THICB3360081 [Thiomonas sp. CB3]